MDEGKLPEVEGGVARAVDVPAWANEHEPTTGGSRSCRSRSISSGVKLGDEEALAGRSPYGIGTCPGIGT